MQHLDLICLAADRDATLKALRELGVVHLDLASAAGAAVQSAQGAAADAEKAVRLILKAREGRDEDEGRPHSVAEVLALDKDRETLLAAADELKRTIRTYGPYGDFDPELAKKLAREGIVLILNEDGTTAIDANGSSHRPDVAKGDATLLSRRPDIASPVPYPPMRLSRLKEKLARVENRINVDTAKIAACDAAFILKDFPALADTIAFERARALMQQHGGVAVVSGWVPETKIATLRAEVKKAGWGILLREPADGETPPTLIEPPKFVRSVRALFEGLGIAPAYDESDVSVPFMCYFSLFFAMLVGDGAYGAIFLAATLWGWKKYRAKSVAARNPVVKSWLVLMTVFSSATIVWGLLSNTWFGASIPWCADWSTVKWLSGAGAPVGHEYDNMMFLCFTIGVTHLMLARIWNGIARINDCSCLTQFGWAGIVLFMYVLTNFIVGIFPAIPTWCFWVFGISFLTVFVQAKGIDKGMLFLNTMSVLGDIISYVRLFAVGLASVKVAENFNGMAVNMGLPVWIKWLPLLFILLVGHGLNLAMAGLSILVHAVRLNTLEFSNHKGISWAGYAFKPFIKTKE